VWLSLWLSLWYLCGGGLCGGGLCGGGLWTMWRLCGGLCYGLCDGLWTLWYDSLWLSVVISIAVFVSVVIFVVVYERCNGWVFRLSLSRHHLLLFGHNIGFGKWNDWVKIAEMIHHSSGWTSIERSLQYIDIKDLTSPSPCCSPYPMFLFPLLCSILWPLSAS
jgi:hypothetical protein